MAKTPIADKDQKQRFIDKARELEADEDEAAFAERLRRIAKSQPSPKDVKAGQKPKP